MTRGILTTCYAPLTDELTAGKKGEEELRQIYRNFYKDKPFVKIVASPPHTKHTWGSNLCLIHPTIDARTCRPVIISCLDNLVKGAAGQAIQNMNLMLGLPETTGLEQLAVYLVRGWPFAEGCSMFVRRDGAFRKNRISRFCTVGRNFSNTSNRGFIRIKFNGRRFAQVDPGSDGMCIACDRYAKRGLVGDIAPGGCG